MYGLCPLKIKRSWKGRRLEKKERGKEEGGKEEGKRTNGHGGGDDARDDIRNTTQQSSGNGGRSFIIPRCTNPPLIPFLCDVCHMHPCFSFVKDLTTSIRGKKVVWWFKVKETGLYMHIARGRERGCKRASDRKTRRGKEQEKGAQCNNRAGTRSKEMPMLICQC